MEEERREDNTEQNGEEEAGSFRESDDIAEEIQQLVEAMARAARNVWSSEQRLQLEGRPAPRIGVPSGEPGGGARPISS